MHHSSPRGTPPKQAPLDRRPDHAHPVFMRSRYLFSKARRLVSCTIPIFLGIALALSVASCARYAHGSARVALGMTRPEVRRACGRPYSQAMRGAAEHWYYHDTAWHGSDPD